MLDEKKSIESQQQIKNLSPEELRQRFIDEYSDPHEVF